MHVSRKLETLSACIGQTKIPMTCLTSVKPTIHFTDKLDILEREKEPAGVFSPKLSRILPPKGAVSPFPAWLKKFEPTVTQNPMTIRRFFIIVIEKYLGKEFKEMRTD
ncbi:hypothetical protein AVEN_251643-1 [Araneus ventricosus]|uniref:Uncharacterized protein n=1 Tax=Araneus ventricosus TaxID=182803 RepID=A0A4Y2FRU5_ARAVE|nr:hypothetical protein AVEN_251643-1 [Araneus ventricosus]